VATPLGDVEARACDAEVRYRILGAQVVSETLIYTFLYNVHRLSAAIAGGHVVTRLVKRAAFGTDGQRYGVYMNAFEVSVPPTQIHHYDG